MKKIFSFLFIFLCGLSICVFSAFAQYNKGRWSSDEDVRLQNGVCSLGEYSWKNVSKNFVFTRSPRQCRERWSYFFADCTNVQWTKEEDDLLITLFYKYGSNWGRICTNFINRNAISIKNRYKFLSYKYINDIKLADKLWTDLEVKPRSYRSSIHSEMADVQELNDEIGDTLNEFFACPTVIPQPSKSISCDALPVIF